MRLPTLTLLLSSLLPMSACSLFGAGEPVVDYVPTLGVTDAQFEMLDVGLLELTGDESPAQAAALLQERFGQREPGGTATERTDVLSDAAGGSSAVYTVSGLADDALQAEQYVAEFQSAGEGALQVTALGRRWRCWRGGAENDGWTNRPCP